jgi:imidazoleglycerol-phosphate dehydratase
MEREADVKRETKETKIAVSLNIDGTGNYEIDTPIGFFNHMLECFSEHGSFDVNIQAEGDTHVDQHHLIEDCGIVLGQAFDRALAGRQGINRAGFFVYPMDDALSLAAVDLSGRPYLQYEARFEQPYCGSMDLALMEDFFRALTVHARANIVVQVAHGRSDHHKAESAFKAFAKAMRMACEKDQRNPGQVPSTKGVI